MIYAKFLNDDNNYWNSFWTKFLLHFEKEFGSTSEVIHATFESDYPKLLNFVNSLSEAIEERAQPTAITPALLSLRYYCNVYCSGRTVQVQYYITGPKLNDINCV